MLLPCSISMAVPTLRFLHQMAHLEVVDVGFAFLDLFLACVAESNAALHHCITLSLMKYELAKQLKDAGFLFKGMGKETQLMCLCAKDICEGPLGRMFRFDGILYPEPTLPSQTSSALQSVLSRRSKSCPFHQANQFPNLASTAYYTIHPMQTTMKLRACVVASFPIATNAIIRALRFFAAQLTW